MSVSGTASPATLATHYHQQLHGTKPFVHTTSGDLHLLAPAAGYSNNQHHAALKHLVSLGVLSEYRYIDSRPQPAILAIRA